MVLGRGTLTGEVEFLLQGRVKRRLLQSLAIGHGGLFPFPCGQVLVSPFHVVGLERRAAREQRETAEQKQRSRLTDERAQSHELHPHPVFHVNCSERWRKKDPERESTSGTRH